MLPLVFCARINLSCSRIRSGIAAVAAAEAARLERRAPGVGPAEDGVEEEEEDFTDFTEFAAAWSLPVAAVVTDFLDVALEAALHLRVGFGAA